MTDPQRYIRTLARRADFLGSPTYHQTSFSLAEKAALEWALVNLQPIVDQQMALAEAQL